MTKLLFLCFELFLQSIPVYYDGQLESRFQTYTWRSFIDLSFLVIVVIVIMNVIVAIFVDSFSELRAKRVRV